MNNIENLREALQFSPENIPLRLHLANTLLLAGSLEEAEKEFKTVLGYQTVNIRAKFGLAQTYNQKGQITTAIVILEELSQNPEVTSEMLVLYAKLLVREKSFAEATEQYKRAQFLDPMLMDEELDNALKQRPYAPGQEDMDEDDFFGEDELIEKPQINFGDVGGMTHVKEEINIKIIQPLLHPELFKAYGKKIGGGILLYGPPGCGKTHLARATAGQVNATFIAVGINDILDMWIGSSEKNLHEIFDTARRNKPCVLFFDEVDALGASRSDMKHSAGRQLINQFLSELDGVQSSNDGVLILAATNAPWHLDTAFRRPGRFDRIIFVSPPDEEGRESILKIMLRGKPTENVDIKDIAKRTKDFSGADIQALIDITIEEKLRESIKTGVPQPISQKDIVNALKRVTPSTKEWFTSARNYALYANESGLYDDILAYLNLKK